MRWVNLLALFPALASGQMATKADTLRGICAERGRSAVNAGRDTTIGYWQNSPWTMQSTVHPALPYTTYIKAVYCSPGSVAKDVTLLAKWWSTDTTIAKITSTGRVTVYVYNRPLSVYVQYPKPKIVKHPAPLPKKKSSA